MRTNHKNLYSSFPEMFKLVELINSSNINYIFKLCILIYHAFRLRTEVIFNNDRL